MRINILPIFDQKISAMHSVKLKIDDKIYENLLGLLRKFNKDELEIIIEDANFQEHKNYLEAELKEVNEGIATFYSVNEVEQRLDKIIKKHENNP
jgi:tRNA 2-selenouridine synthase SelU